MMLQIFRFASIMLTALSLVPAGAHLMELVHKMPMSAEEYLTVQRLYRGWAWSGVVIMGALASTLALAVLVRHQAQAFTLTAVAFACLAGTQILFWTFTFPVNQATSNWTELPHHWMQLRQQWEYSHAASAVLNVLALAALVAAALLPNGDR